LKFEKDNKDLIDSLILRERTCAERENNINLDRQKADDLYERAKQLEISAEKKERDNNARIIELMQRDHNIKGLSAETARLNSELKLEYQSAKTSRVRADEMLSETQELVKRERVRFEFERQKLAQDMEILEKQKMVL
jgi:hypothetical protein